MHKIVIIGQKSDVVSNLKKVIDSHSKNFKLSGITRTVQEGVKLIDKTTPDIILICLKQKKTEILEFIEEVSVRHLKIIVVSDNENFAIDAIKYGVIDYVLIPFDDQTILASLEKCVESINWEATEELGFISKDAGQLVAISMLSRIEIIKTEDILFCQAQGRYTIFNVLGEKQKISSKHLGFYNELLEEGSFFRIHHKYLVNLNHVKEVFKKESGHVICHLHSGEMLPVSLRKYKSLRNFLYL